MTEGKQRARVEGRREGAGAPLTNHAPLNTRNLSYSLLPFGLSTLSYRSTQYLLVAPSASDKHATY